MIKHWLILIGINILAIWGIATRFGSDASTGSGAYDALGTLIFFAIIALVIFDLLYLYWSQRTKKKEKE